MGASFWQHHTPYNPEAEAALNRLQAEVFHDSGYDLETLMQERIVDMTQAVRSCEEDDPYHLLGHYRDCLRSLRQLSARGVPDDSPTKIALLREVEAIGSDRASGVLAVESVSTEWEVGKARLLTEGQLVEVFGTSTPSADNVDEGVDRLAEAIDRGMAVCFPVFVGGHPEFWYFAGYTWD